MPNPFNSWDFNEIIDAQIADNVNTSYVNNAFNGGHEMEERAVDSKTTAERIDKIFFIVNFLKL